MDIAAATSAIDPQAQARVSAILGEDGLAQAYQPIDSPSGLPNVAYWSDEWLRLEQQRIFHRSWVFCAAEAEIARSGDALPAHIGGVPIIILRDRGGKVRAFHNHCRHRGTQLLQEACEGIKTLTCPYHAWVYGLDGHLRSRPHFHGPGEMERFENGGGPQLDLVPVRCETWNGCIFVNISGDASLLIEWLAPMLERTAAFDFSNIRWIGKKPYPIQSNWKLILENYMEGYHVFAAHPRLIEHAPMHVRWSGEWLQHVFYNDYIAPHLSEGRGDGLPQYPNLSEENSRRGIWFACLPNFAVEVYADQFVVLAVNPVAPDLTQEELHFFVVGDAAAEDARYGGARQELMQMWNDLNLEDVELLERLQNGRRSPAFNGNVMSPAWEVPAHQFAQKIIEAIVSERAI